MTERGDRVKLIHVNDPHTKLAPGTLGTVTSVDSLGTVHVKWDDGHHLGLVAEAGDAYRVLASEPSDAACMEADIEKLRHDDDLKREARR